MPTLRDSDEEKDDIRERIGQGGEDLEDLPLRRSSGPLYDPPVSEEMERGEAVTEEEDLLGPTRRSDRSWGTLAAAAVLMVALLGVFLWYQRPGAPKITPPPYAPPAVAQPPVEETPEAALEEPDAPPAAEPEVIEEMPAEPEPEPEQPEIVPASPAPPRPARPVQIAETPHAPEPAPVEPPAPKRTILSGPPADRLAGVLRPGPGVEMPVPLDLPRARYPEAARGTGLRVDVHLDLLVDEQGKVVEALVREEDPANLTFNEAAVRAARDTRFQPATRWDLPGKAWTELIIEFAEPRLESERGR
jgi:protein TonB